MNTRLTIRNFGPIRSADIDFDKYTFFIGAQGAGKSTIVKLFSCFTWCEKALARHQYTEKQSQYHQLRWWFELALPGHCCVSA